MPALFTRMSIRPNSCTRALTRASMLPMSGSIRGSARARRPVSAIARTGRPQAFHRPGQFGGDAIGPGLGHGHGNRLSEARSGPRNQGDLAVQPHAGEYHRVVLVRACADPGGSSRAPFSRRPGRVARGCETDFGVRRLAAALYLVYVAEGTFSSRLRLRNVLRQALRSRKRLPSLVVQESQDVYRPASVRYAFAPVDRDRVGRRAAHDQPVRQDARHATTTPSPAASS